MALTGVPPAVFMRGGNADDPRARRTRGLLLATFEAELAAGRANCTVASLVRAAGVSRSSFYSHFTSIEEVGVAAMREILNDFHGPRDEFRPAASEPSTASLVELFEHLAAHRALCAALLTVTGDRHPAYSELHAILVEHFAGALASAEATIPIDVSKTSKFLVGGLMALLVEWLHQPDCSAGALSLTFEKLLPEWLRSSPMLTEPLRLSEE
ncbi:TetR/AcrR family transcriptional regulator [Nocardia sp. NPDC050799]|uniref:TetR/AcrR family transcriptional regulator n=1 Tax=Nocardia sp. NPDC050799 TaxID=3154842 RepID=UPI0033EEBAB1